MTELERELRGLAAAIDFPETPEIAAAVDLRGQARPRRTWSRRVARLGGGRDPRRCCRCRPRRPAGANRNPPPVRDWQRCASSSSTSCRRCAPMGHSCSAPRSIPTTRPRFVLRPTGARRAGRDLSRRAGRDTALRHAGARQAADHGDRGDGLHAGGSPRSSRPRERGSSSSAFAAPPGRPSGSPGNPHVVELPGGPRRLAANTLIWARGPLTIRLEGAASLQQALAIGNSLSLSGGTEPRAAV